MWTLIKLKIRLMKDNIALYAIMIGMSLLLAGVFSQSMTGNYLPTIAIVNHAETVEASDLITDLNRQGQFQAQIMAEDDAISAVSDHEAIAAVIIEKEGQDKMAVQMVTLNESIESYELESAINAHQDLEIMINRVTDQVLALDLQESEQAIRLTFWDKWNNEKPIHVISQMLDIKGISQVDDNIHYLLGMTLFFLSYSILFTVEEILEDKRLKTFDRMMVSPVNQMSILLANLVPALVIGLIQFAVMVLSGQWVFGVNWGSHMLLVSMVSIAYLIAMTGISLFIVMAVKTISQLNALAPIILTGMGMIGGCMWPLEIVSSKLILTLSYFTPHRWAIQAIENAMMYGESNFGAIGVLLLMGLVGLVAGERLMSRKTAL